MKKVIKLKKKFTNKVESAKVVIDKYPKGEVVMDNPGYKLTLKFDKNGGLWDMTPRVGDLLNTYRGRARSAELCAEINDLVSNFYVAEQV